MKKYRGTKYKVFKRGTINSHPKETFPPEKMILSNKNFLLNLIRLSLKIEFKLKVPKAKFNNEKKKWNTIL